MPFRVFSRPRVLVLFSKSVCCLILAFAGLTASGDAFARGEGIEGRNATAGGVAFPFGPSLSASGWKAVNFPRRRPVKFTARGKDTLVVETTGGAGLLWRSAPATIANPSKAQWRWRKIQGVGPTDLTRKGGDDRVLALYFAFADPKDVKAGTDLTSLLKRGRGDVLMYVWGGAGTRGTVLKLPYFNGRGRTIMTRAANTKPGVWFEESASLRADFKRAFGRTPGRLVAVAVSSDADDTGGRNIAALADLYVQ